MECMGSVYSARNFLMVFFCICFGIALSHSGYEPRITPPQQDMERAACPFHTRMHVR